MAPTDIDICITNIKDAVQLQHVRESIADALPEKASAWNFRILFRLPSDSRIDPQSSDREWLLCNVVRACIVVVMSCELASNVRTSSFTSLFRHITTTTTSPKTVDIKGFDEVLLNPSTRQRLIEPLINAFPSRPKLALLICINPKRYPTHRPTILDKLLPTLGKTLHTKRLQYGVFLAFQDNDSTYTNQERDAIYRTISRHQGFTLESVTTYPQKAWTGRTKSVVVNNLYELAMMHAYDFAIPLEDHFHVITNVWDQKAGAYLCGNPCGIGGAALQNCFHPSRIQACMVSRIHYDIFGYYEPPETRDRSQWFCGVYGTYAYIVSRTTYSDNTDNATRPCPLPQLPSSTITQDREKLDMAVLHLASKGYLQQ